MVNMLKNYVTDRDYAKFDRENAYSGEDLGVVYEDGITRFKVWAPHCTAAYLNLYTSGEGDNKVETLCMRKIERGVWYVELMHDAFGLYYTYTFEFEHNIRVETIDVYAKACGVNGDRGYIADFEALNPEGWEDTSRPVCQNPAGPQAAPADRI